MTTDDVIKYFGSRAAAARAAGVTRQAANNWGDYPSRECQLDFQLITDGQLVAEPRPKKSSRAA